jgi:hypothetical protein
LGKFNRCRGWGAFLYPFYRGRPRLCKIESLRDWGVFWEGDREVLRKNRSDIVSQRTLRQHRGHKVRRRQGGIFKGNPKRYSFTEKAQRDTEGTKLDVDGRVFLTKKTRQRLTLCPPCPLRFSFVVIKMPLWKQTLCVFSPYVVNKCCFVWGILPATTWGARRSQNARCASGLDDRTF